MRVSKALLFPSPCCRSALLAHAVGDRELKGTRRVDEEPLAVVELDHQLGRSMSMH